MKKYPNLIIDFVPSKPNELWVSDISHWKTGDNLFFLHLITDAYSRKIVGYQVSVNLLGSETIKALKMALRELFGENCLREVMPRLRQTQVGCLCLPFMVAVLFRCCFPNLPIFPNKV